MAPGPHLAAHSQAQAPFGPNPAASAPSSASAALSDRGGVLEPSLPKQRLDGEAGVPRLGSGWL